MIPMNEGVNVTIRYNSHNERYQAYHVIIPLGLPQPKPTNPQAASAGGVAGRG